MPDKRKPDGTDLEPRRGLDRRGFLAAGAQGALAVAGASLLASCGGTSGGPSTSSTSASRPTRGGTLRLGIFTGGSAEQLLPSFNFQADISRSLQLYDRLFDCAADLRTLIPRLALSAEPNRDATVWTFKLRSGVVWHDGKPFGADDVVHTLRSWESSQSLTYGFFDGVIDYKQVRARGRLAVEVPLVAPYGQFPGMVAQFPDYGIMQNGSTFASTKKHPIGTGPFKFESFTPGQQSVFVANHEYWQHGGPYVDRLIINSSFTDDSTRLNALLSGSIDVMSDMPGLLAKQQLSNGQITILRSPSPYAQVIYMNLTKPPFTDVRVRQAMRLVADRPALIEGALAGFGTPGNDLFGKGNEFFANDLVRTRDVEQAKALLKAAGKEGLSVPLKTSIATPSGVQVATLFAQQAKDAGVNVITDVGPSASYFDSSAGYPYPFGQDIYPPGPSLSAIYRTAFVQYPETAWNVKGDVNMNAAFHATNTSTAAEKWRAVQVDQFNHGGHIIWGLSDFVDGVANHVHGLRAGPTDYLNHYRILDGWLTNS